MNILRGILSNIELHIRPKNLEAHREQDLEKKQLKEQ
jgi:hypothetical protein